MFQQCWNRVATWLLLVVKNHNSDWKSEEFLWDYVLMMGQENSTQSHWCPLTVSCLVNVKIPVPLSGGRISSYADHTDLGNMDRFLTQDKYSQSAFPQTLHMLCCKSLSRSWWHSCCSCAQSLYCYSQSTLCCLSWGFAWCCFNSSHPGTPSLTLLERLFHSLVDITMAFFTPMFILHFTFLN